MELRKMTKLGNKEFLTKASLGWKRSGLYNKDREFQTHKHKYVRDFIHKSNKGGRVCAFNRYFESTQFDETLLTIKKHPNIHDNKISSVIDKHI